MRIDMAAARLPLFPAPAGTGDGIRRGRISPEPDERPQLRPLFLQKSRGLLASTRGDGSLALLKCCNKNGCCRGAAERSIADAALAAHTFFRIARHRYAPIK